MKYNIIDIGSAGLLSEPWSYSPDKVGAVLKFEPRDSDEQVPNVTFLPYALWSETEERDFYIYRGFKGTGSSLFRQNYHYVAANFPELKQRGDSRLAHTWFERSGEVRRLRLSCRTLDSILQELREQGHGIAYDFLKVDAQGADFQILTGAREYLLRDCVAVQCELFTLPLYEGITLLDEATAWMEAQGFKLWLKMPAHGTFASQHDCIFLKSRADTRDLESVLQRPAPKRTVIRRMAGKLRDLIGS